MVAYFSLCDLDILPLRSFFSSHSNSIDAELCQKAPGYTLLNTKVPLAIFAGKKYKPVTLKVCSVETKLPSRFQITHNIKGDPLKDMPTLSLHLPSYMPKGWYTKEQKEVIDKAHPGNFLLLEERKLLYHFMCKQNEGFAWTDQERSHFKEEFFPPIEIPIIPHKP